MDDKVKVPPLKRDVKRLPPGDAPATTDGRVRKGSAIWPTLGLLVVVGGLCGAGYWIYRTTAPASAPATAGRTGRSGAPAASVGVASAVSGTIRVYVNALGTVTPLSTVTVQTQINGQLQQIAFKEGQLVKKGDFLAQIDSRPYQVLKAQYEGQLARDQGLLNQARTDNVRYQTLLQQNSIARQQAEDQVYVVEQAEGTVKIDQALIDAQALNIAYCRIVAPIDGRVGLRLVDEGNYVQTSSSTGLAVITQVHPISVLFPVAEDTLAEIAPQVKAGTKLQATVYDRSNVKQLAVGAVTTLDNQIDTTTGTVKLRAVFENADDTLFANQFVNVKLLVKTLDGVVTVPSAAIQHGAPGAFAYVVDASGKVSVRVVTLGPADGDVVSVTKGLAVGEHVVVDGADRLRDGAQVSISALDGKPVAARAAPDASAPTPGDTGTGSAAPDATNQPAAPARDPARRHKPADGQNSPPATNGQ